jgi:hypothetical protein
MGQVWPEQLEEGAVTAISRSQREDGGFEASRPPLKWVHGFVKLAPSAAAIGVLASFLEEPNSVHGEWMRESYERRLTRWETISLRSIEYLLASRVGRYRAGTELSGWHSDRQPEEGRIDLSTTSIAVRALCGMHDVLSRLINRRAFAGLLVKHPEPKAPKELFVFDCESTDPAPDEHPLLVTSQQATEWLQHHTKAFPGPDSPAPPDEYRPRTTLYYGPPGTGKTYASEIVAGELRWPLVVVNPYHFLREGDHMVGKVAADIFERLQFASNCCVIFDEFDQLIVDRNLQEMPSPFAMVTTTMLPLLADLHERAVKENCLIAFVTNYRALLDAAAIRQGRIDQQSCVVYPDFGSRYLKHLIVAEGCREEWNKAGTSEWLTPDSLNQRTIATAMRAVSDVIKVAGTPGLVHRQTNLAAPAPALGSAHYADMFQKLAKKGLESGTASLEREFERFQRSLGVDLVDCAVSHRQLRLPEAELGRWVKLSTERKRLRDRPNDSGPQA